MLRVLSDELRTLFARAQECKMRTDCLKMKLSMLIVNGNQNTRHGARPQEFLVAESTAVKREGMERRRSLADLGKNKKSPVLDQLFYVAPQLDAVATGAGRPFMVHRKNTAGMLGGRVLRRIDAR